ncbi:MAG: hypothetical protein CMO69_06635 [Verrucomicrobiales bacterium]|nr:hypothetical protein [Verrucomicrobiales bacterium]MBE87394.1 hypothetical protein [Verrucomicrobiales bacterium]|tara:strand:- start:444 stop:653 length:210 start_codon:yes stop_codon:yes gene_type:complete
MRLLVALLALAGVSVGALGYFAFNGKSQSGNRINLIGINDSSATSVINTDSSCKSKCCDEKELETKDPS